MIMMKLAFTVRRPSPSRRAHRDRIHVPTAAHAGRLCRLSGGTACIGLTDLPYDRSHQEKTASASRFPSRLGLPTLPTGSIRVILPEDDHVRRGLELLSAADRRDRQDTDWRRNRPAQGLAPKRASSSP